MVNSGLVATRFRIAACWITLLAASMVTGLPFYWAVITSLKGPEEAAAWPPTWWPHHVEWGNIARTWNAAPFGRFFVNSLVTSLCATALQIGCALTMAYAFAFLRFPGKRILFWMVLATMMVPEEAKLVPNFVTLSKLDWIDTWWALIIPSAAHAFPIFVLHEHFKTLPRDVLDSARIEGAGHLRVLTAIVIPLSAPIVAAVALVAFAGRWNDYLWPLVATNSESMRTLPVGLAYLQAGQEGGQQWNFLMMGAIFVIIPLFVLFFSMQRFFQQGLIRGAVKA